MFTDYELSQAVLAREGLSPEQITRTLLVAPVSEERIAAMRAELEAEFQASRARAFAESPEGRVQAALAAQERKAERDNLVSAARTLLAEEYPGHDFSKMTERETLVSAGIEKKERSEMSVREWDEEVLALAQGWRHLSDEQRRDECRRLEQDPAQMTSYVETFLGGALATNGGES